MIPKISVEHRTMRLGLMFAVVTYHYCDQMPDKKQFGGGVVYWGSLFGGAVHCGLKSSEAEA